MPAPSWVEFMDLDYLSTICGYEFHGPFFVLLFVHGSLPLLPSELIESCFFPLVLYSQETAQCLGYDQYYVYLPCVNAALVGSGVQRRA